LTEIKKYENIVLANFIFKVINTMDQQQWDDIESVILRTRNRDSTNAGSKFSFNYDGGFQNALSYLHRPKAFEPFERKECKTNDDARSWISREKDIESSMISSHRSLIICNTGIDLKGLELETQLISQKKILASGVKRLPEVDTFLPWDSNRPKLVQNLFEIAQIAIEAFQQNPTALILFPNLEITDCRVLGGWYGSPWGNHNAYSLSTYFREINPWFNIRVVSIAEIENGKSPDRKIAIHFTYKGLYNS
jgi:hypothetical protein